MIRALGDDVLDLSTAAEALEHAAADFAEWAPRWPPDAQPVDTARIEELVLKLQQCEWGTEARRRAAKAVQRARRTERRAWEKRKAAAEAMSQPREDKKMGTTQFEFLEEQVAPGVWQRVEQPEDWPGVVRKFYFDLFRGRVGRRRLEKQAKQHREFQENWEQLGWEAPCISTCMVQQAQSEIKPNKSGKPGEHLVPNLVREWPGRWRRSWRACSRGGCEV